VNASRGMYIRNTAHIILNLEYIRNADINELGAMVLTKRILELYL
jgi:hypothetical protein